MLSLLLRSRSTYLLILIAVTIPFVVVDRLRGYSCDVEIFDAWAQCIWRGAAVDGVCQRFHVNYPAVGILFSAGLMQLLTDIGIEGNFTFRAQPFRQTLAIFDAMNILLFFALLKAFRVRFAEWWTLGFALLPSTWVGGASFGQIDGVSQFFLSLGFLSLNRAWSVLDAGESPRGVDFWLASLIASILIVLCVKQLVVFTVPVLMLAFAYLLYRFASRFGAPWRVCGIIMTLLSILFVLDRMFPTPAGYFGSAWVYAIGAGSAHGGEIGYNGFNLFTLLPVHPSSPSNRWYEFFTIGRVRVIGVPMYLGLALFLSFNLVSVWCVSRLVRPLRTLDAERGTVAALAVAASLNLSMNIFLTGTHERYLYHYGFLVVPCALWLLGQGRIGRWGVALIATHLTVYGAFVFSKIGALPLVLRPLGSSRVVLATTFLVCVGALARLVYVTLRRKTAQDAPTEPR